MNMGELTEITLIVPTRNQSEFLASFLESLKLQTFTRWKCILINDGSTDLTSDLLEQYASGDLRFEILTLPTSTTGNAQLARNHGITRLHTKYVMFCDSDDFFPKRALELLYARLNAQPDLDFVYGQTEVFLKQPGDQRIVVNIPKRTSDLDRVLLGDMPFMVQAILCRTHFITTKRIVWTPHVKQWQDWDFLFTLLSYRPRYQPLDEITYYWRNEPRSSRISLQSGPRILKNRICLYFRWIKILKSQRLITQARIKIFQKALVGVNQLVNPLKISVRVVLRLQVIAVSTYLNMSEFIITRRNKPNSLSDDLLDDTGSLSIENSRRTLVRVSTYEWIATLLKENHGRHAQNIHHHSHQE